MASGHVCDAFRNAEWTSDAPSTAQPCGGRTWWAHFEFTRINIAPTILSRKMEDEPEASASRIKILAMLDIAQQRPAAGRPHQIEERANAPLTLASRRFRRIWARKS